MGKKDPRIDEYIARSARFAQPILKHLRKSVHTACPEVEETIKWSMPFFVYRGNLCNMAAFKEHCAFGFWQRALLKEKHPELADAEDPAMGVFGRITAVSDLPSEKVLIGYIKDAAALNEKGIKAPAKPKSKVAKPIDIPDYFSAALKKNRKAQATFDQFPPSHKREYLEWITEAKTEETRERRLSQAIEWMAEGKSRNWKYMKK